MTVITTGNLKFDVHFNSKPTHGRTEARAHGQNELVIVPFLLFQVQRCCLWLHLITDLCMWSTTYVPLWDICILASNTRKLQYNGNKTASYLPFQISASFTTVSVEAQTIYIVPFTLPHTPLPLHSPPLHLRLSDTDLHCKPLVSRAGHLNLLYRKGVFKVHIFNLSFSQFRDILRVHLKHYVVKATGLTFALHIGGWLDP